LREGDPVSQQAKDGGVEYVLRGTDRAAMTVNGGIQIVGSVTRTWPSAPNLRKRRQSEYLMPTFIKMVIKLEESAWFPSDDFCAVVLFSGIGLVVTLIAVNCGVQGVWL
jgi:hypothetical protein